MSFIDYLIIITLLVSLTLGFFRGFLREAIGLLGWLGGLWLAWHFADAVQPFLGGALQKQPFNLWAARGVLLLAVLVVSWLVGNVLSYFVAQSGVSLMLDRILGLLFGLLRGVVLVALAVFLAREVNLQESAWWRYSITLPVATEVSTWLKGFAESGLHTSTSGREG